MDDGRSDSIQGWFSESQLYLVSQSYQSNSGLVVRVPIVFGISELSEQSPEDCVRYSSTALLSCPLDCGENIGVFSGCEDDTGVVLDG